MKIGNQMQNHKIETMRELVYENGSIWLTLIFYQNYRQRYTVIPITTVSGSFWPLTHTLNKLRRGSPDAEGLMED